jgi:hypothetical protein
MFSSVQEVLLLLMNGSLLQDYYNLVDVYLDAVLQPRCVTDPKTFAQEGWHYELDDAKVPPISMQLKCAVKAENKHLVQRALDVCQPVTVNQQHSLHAA